MNKLLLAFMEKRHLIEGMRVSCEDLIALDRVFKYISTLCTQYAMSETSVGNNGTSLLFMDVYGEDVHQSSLAIEMYLNAYHVPSFGIELHVPRWSGVADICGDEYELFYCPLHDLGKCTLDEHLKFIGDVFAAPKDCEALWSVLSKV